MLGNLLLRAWSEAYKNKNQRDQKSSHSKFI